MSLFTHLILMLFKRSSRIIDMDVRNSDLLTPQNGKPNIVITNNKVQTKRNTFYKCTNKTSRSPKMSEISAFPYNQDC